MLYFTNRFLSLPQNCSSDAAVTLSELFAHLTAKLFTFKARSGYVQKERGDIKELSEMFLFSRDILLKYIYCLIFKCHNSKGSA